VDEDHQSVFPAAMVAVRLAADRPDEQRHRGRMAAVPVDDSNSLSAPVTPATVLASAVEPALADAVAPAVPVLFADLRREV
jgi:hypothetical protein